MENNNMDTLYDKVIGVIKSAVNYPQLKTATKMYNVFLDKYKGSTHPKIDVLVNLIKLKNKELTQKDNIEEDFASTDDFKREVSLAASQTDSDELRKAAASMKEEINIGAQIEGNHLDKDEALELSTTNVNNTPNYYTDPNFCVIAVENKNGEKRTVRVEKDLYEKSKEGKEQLLLADMEIYHENLDFNNITQSLRDQLKKRNSRKYHPDEIFDKIGELKGKELERREKENQDWADLWSDDEEIEEGTGAVSSGSYVTKLGDETIRPALYQVPVTKDIVKKQQTGLPIGKMFSYKGKTSESEILEEDDIEEAVSYSDAVGAYDTPGFAPSKFMGTAGKKGKAPVNKGITHTKLAYPGGEFVKIKNRCARFPYCNQSPEAIRLSKKPFKDAFYENKIIKKGKLKIKK